MRRCGAVSARASRAAATCSAKIASSSWRALKPLARRIALRSHCSPNTSSSPPTTRRSTPIGSAVSAGPSTATTRGERQQRGADPGPCRAPVAGDADGEHDRDRLDGLDRASGEHREEEQDVVTHRVSSSRRHLQQLCGDDAGDYSQGERDGQRGEHAIRRRRFPMPVRSAATGSRRACWRRGRTQRCDRRSEQAARYEARKCSKRAMTRRLARAQAMSRASARAARRCHGSSASRRRQYASASRASATKDRARAQARRPEARARR